MSYTLGLQHIEITGFGQIDFYLLKSLNIEVLVNKWIKNYQEPTEVAKTSTVYLWLCHFTKQNVSNAEIQQQSVF